MPGDHTDEIGAPEPPRLCPDDMAHHDTENARAERARFALRESGLRHE